MKFSRQFYYLLLAIVFFFLLAKGLEQYFSKSKLLSKYAALIEENLQQYEQEIEAKLKNETFFLSELDANKTNYGEIKNFAKRHYNICLYHKDSLLFWSNSIAFPTPALLENLSVQQPIFTQLSNGYFAVRKHSLSFLQDSEKYAISLIPIKWEYDEHIKNLNAQFEAGSLEKIPGNLRISLSQSKYPIHSRQGKAICYLQETDDFIDKGILKWLLFCYLIGFVLLGITINIIAQKLQFFNKPWLGPAFLLITVFGLRFFSQDWSLKFQEFQVFERSFENPSVSVGDLLINIILLLWVVIFIHRESKGKNFKVNFPPNIRFFLTTMNYLSVILALLILISVLKSLVLNSGIAFDFKNVFNLDQYSVIAVLGVILLLFTQFVFSHRMMITIHRLNLSQQKRLIAGVLAVGFSLPIIYFIDLQIPLHITALLAFIFVLAYDLFIDMDNPGLVWLVGWIVLFAGVSSGLLYKYNMDKEEKEELVIAEGLAQERDQLVERALLSFKSALHFEAPQITSTDSPSVLGKIKEKVYTSFFNQSYLYNNYKYRVYGFNDRGEFYFKDQLPGSLESWEQKITQSRPLETDPNIYFYSNSKGNQSYLLRIESPFANSAKGGIHLFFEFEKASRKRSKVYIDLLTDEGFKGLKNIENYDYAIIKNGLAVEEEGIEADDPDFVFPNEPEIGGYDKTPGTRGNTINFMYRFGEKDYVILSKKKNNLFHPVSLFSYIFCFLAILVLLFALANSKLRILPYNFNFNLWNKPSLKNRVQFSTIFLTIASFILIGIVSVYFLRDSYISYDRDRLGRKASSVLANAEQFLGLESDSLDFLQNVGNLNFLRDYIGVLSETHRIDVNLFDRNGDLIQSSEMDIFKKGVIPPKMSARAYEYLEKFNLSDYVQIEEYISDYSFMTAFMSLKDANGKKLAYLSVPYSNKQRVLQDDVADFMGNLLNVYVFLLLVAGSISIIMANSITKPITAIGENLKEIKLGNPNEPLEWRTNDEIGALISEYNRMILKLEHSAKLLARSEREGAWREMAKQVAHEIKNPLTPMKLSIQYLQHAFQSNPENIEPLLKRVSHTLIEQIDNLAQIASEFSSFAKMPRANNQQIKLNDLVESVHDLFKEHKNMDVLLSLPEDDFYVFADKNHLMRVLNNMIKNAIESIPKSRRGKIQVSLYKMGSMAIIQVEDNGEGIPEEMKSKVFVPNFTTKNSGTGLGLAISKNIIESVNGKIYFETEKDKGTNFYVELPLEDMLVN